MALLSQVHLLLLAGNENQLLHTQVLLFKFAGFETIVVHTPEDARLVLTDIEVRGVVIGHSLNSKAQEKIASDARAIRPAAAILELVRGDCEPANLVSWARSIGCSIPDRPDRRNMVPPLRLIPHKVEHNPVPDQSPADKR
jgi:hypothetical protein